MVYVLYACVILTGTEREPEWHEVTVAVENDGRTTRAKVSEVQRLTNLVEERQKPDDETTPSTATTSFVSRLTTGMMLNVVNN